MSGWYYYGGEIKQTTNIRIQGVVTMSLHTSVCESTFYQLALESPRRVNGGHERSSRLKLAKVGPIWVISVKCGQEGSGEFK